MNKFLSSIAIAALCAAPAVSAQTSNQDQPVTVKAGPLNVALPAGVTKADLGKRDAQMIAVQVMLDRSRHSPGVIDGYGGGNTDRAIAAYRQAHNLSDSGVDRGLLQSLLEDQSGDIFRTYTLTQEDLSYDFVDVPDDFAAKARLEALNYESPLELLAERFHMDEKFLKAINPGVDFSRAGTTINIVSHGDETLDGSIAKIEVRKGEGAVIALDASGKVLASYPATIGSSDFPSPSGSMTVSAIAPAPNYTFDPDDQDWGPDETLIIQPGPNNPVGGTWIDLGKDGYGIHGSPDPQLIGKTASHGCVRLTNWDAEELAKAVSQGIPVVFT